MNQKSRKRSTEEVAFQYDKRNIQFLADKKDERNASTPCSFSGSSGDGSGDSDSSGSASTSSSRSVSPAEKTLTGELDETLKPIKSGSEEAESKKEELLTAPIAEKELKISPTSLGIRGSCAVKAISATYSPEKHCPPKQTRKRPNVKRGGGTSKPSSSSHHHVTSISAVCSSSNNDVYEFHSSPESNEMPSMAASLQKTSSTSALAPEIEGTSSKPATNTPPPKRIKTAALAKELLAAAAASGSPLSCNFSKMEETTVLVEDQKKTVFSPMEGGELVIDEEDYDMEAGQAYFSSSNLPLIGPETHAETKKVPPLRIMLPKTPSEEDGGSETHSPTLSVSTVAKKQRGATSKHTGDKEKSKKHHHHHHHHSEGNKKEDTQRLTRSRVKQTGAILNEVPRWGQKRGRAARTATDSTYQADPDAVKLDQEEEEVEGEAEGPEDEYSRSDAGEESRSAFERQSKEPEEGVTVSQKVSTTSASATLLLFSKNSFDQTVEFSRMIHEKWAKGFVDELQRDVARPSHLADVDRIEFVHRQTQAEQKLPLIVNLQESWPESLQKLAIEHARRREQMEITHKAERERLFQFGKRELVRLMQKSAAYSHSNINVVRLLRDAELYNPSTFDSAMDEPPEIQLVSGAQLLQRLKHMASTTKNRHTMEAHSLVVCQQAEWDKMSSRICHQNSISDSYGSNKLQMTHLGVAQVHVEETLFPFMQ